MRLVPIYQTPNTSKKHPQHKSYPYLLRGLEIERPIDPNPQIIERWQGNTGSTGFVKAQRVIGVKWVETANGGAVGDPIVGDGWFLLLGSKPVLYGFISIV